MPMSQAPSAKPWPIWSEEIVCVVSTSRARASKQPRWRAHTTGAGGTKRIWRKRVMATKPFKTERGSLLKRVFGHVNATIARRTDILAASHGAAQEIRGPGGDLGRRVSLVLQARLCGYHAGGDRQVGEGLARKRLHLLRLQARDPLRDLRPVAARAHRGA